MLSMYFKSSAELNENKKQVVELFLKSWIDNVCQQQVEYSIDKECIRVDFNQDEDASAVVLNGVPSELKNLVKIVH